MSGLLELIWITLIGLLVLSYVPKLRKYTGMGIAIIGGIFTLSFIVGLFIQTNVFFGLGWAIAALISFVGLFIGPMLGHLLNEGVGGMIFFLVSFFINIALTNGCIQAGLYIAKEEVQEKNKSTLLVSLILGAIVTTILIGYVGASLGIIVAK